VARCDRTALVQQRVAVSYGAQETSRGRPRHGARKRRESGQGDRVSAFAGRNTCAPRGGVALAPRLRQAPRLRAGPFPRGRATHVPARRRGASATPPRGALLGRGGQRLAAGNSWDRNPCLRARRRTPCAPELTAVPQHFSSPTALAKPCRRPEQPGRGTTPGIATLFSACCRRGPSQGQMVACLLSRNSTITSHLKNLI